MSFDPGELTVKRATEALVGLSDEELEAVYDAELEGRGRVSLLNAITSKRDDLREEPEAAAPEPAADADAIYELVHRPARPGSAAATYRRKVK